MRLAAAQSIAGGLLTVLVVACLSVSGCGGGDEAAAPATTEAAQPPKTTTPAAAGPTAAESAWLEKSTLSELLAKIEKDAAEFARSGSITADIGDLGVIGGGKGECRVTLESAGKPPTARLEKVRKLTRAACVQAERANNQVLTYTLTGKSGQVVEEHQSDPAAAAASMKRASKLATQAAKALDAVTSP